MIRGDIIHSLLIASSAGLNSKGREPYPSPMENAFDGQGSWRMPVMLRRMITDETRISDVDGLCNTQ